MRGSSGNTTTTTTADPWAAQQPYLTAGFDQAANLYDSAAPQFFPASTVTPFSTETGQALDMGAARARGGSPLLRAGQGAALDTLQGDYLSQGNPHTAGVVSKLDSAIRPQVQSMFARAGGSGPSFGETDAYARSIADATAPYLFQDYGNERNRMLQTQAMAPTMAAADYVDPGELARVGARREDLGSRVLQDEMARWDFGQQQPSAKLRDYFSMIRGDYGGTQTTTQPTYRNPVAGALGGAATGAGIGMAAQQLGLLGAGSPWMWPLIGGSALMGAV